MVLGHLDIYMQKPYTSYKINSKSIIDLDVKYNTVKVFEENKRKFL